MKTFKIILAAIFIISLSSCMQAKKSAPPKITDIPVTTKSKDAEQSVRQGLALLDVGDGTKARAMFIQATQQDPKLGLAYLLKVNTDVTPEESASDMSKAKANLDSASQWEKWYYDYYQTFFNSDWNKRVAVTKQIADSFPDAARAQVDLGFAYQTGNDNSNARASFMKALTIDSNSVAAYSGLANSFLFLDPKDFKKAEMYALKVVGLAPSSPGAEITLGDCYRAENDLQKARDAYAKAVQLDPGAPEAYYKEGHANTFLGNYDEARKNYMDGASHDRTATAAIQTIAYTYIYAGDAKAGLKYFDDYMSKLDTSKQSPDQVRAAKLACLGDCQFIAFHIGDTKALQQYNAAAAPLALKSADVAGTAAAKLNAQANNLFEDASVSVLQGKYDDAKTKAEQMKTILDPVNDPNKLNTYHWLLGIIAMKQKNYTDAISQFSACNQNTTIYYPYWLAKANEAAGNKDKAADLYKQIAVYNFNGVDYAVIRSEVLKKIAATKT